MLLRNILRWKKILRCLEHQKSIISHEGPLKERHKALLCCFILQRQRVSDPWHEGASWNKRRRRNVLYSYILESKEFKCNILPGSFLWHLCLLLQMIQRPSKAWEMPISFQSNGSSMIPRRLNPQSFKSSCKVNHLVISYIWELRKNSQQETFGRSS